MYWMTWSIIAEVIGPRVYPHVVGDGWDIAAYAAGALIAGLWWNRHVLIRNSKV